jgi:hypothetical protein
MPEACIEYGTSFPCIRELHPCLARSDVQALPFGGNPFRTLLFPGCPMLRKSRNRKACPALSCGSPRASNGRVLAHAIPPTGLFSRSFVLDRNPNSPPSLPTLSTSLFFEAYFFQSLVQYRSSSFSSHSHRRQSAAPCRSLATILTCLTRVTVPDKPAETGFSLTCRRGRCFGL